MAGKKISAAGYKLIVLIFLETTLFVSNKFVNNNNVEIYDTTKSRTTTG